MCVWVFLHAYELVWVQSVVHRRNVTNQFDVKIMKKIRSNHFWLNTLYHKYPRIRDTDTQLHFCTQLKCVRFQNKNAYMNVCLQATTNVSNSFALDEYNHLCFLKKWRWETRQQNKSLRLNKMSSHKWTKKIRASSLMIGSNSNVMFDYYFTWIRLITI